MKQSKADDRNPWLSRLTPFRRTPQARPAGSVFVP